MIPAIVPDIHWGHIQNYMFLKGHVRSMPDARVDGEIERLFPVGAEL
jgi:hypothetical protein